MRLCRSPVSLSFPHFLIWFPFPRFLSFFFSLPVSGFLPFFIYNLPHTPFLSNSISVSCFGRTCWASAKAIMRTVKQRQMNRWESCREKDRAMKTQREREAWIWSTGTAVTTDSPLTHAWTHKYTLPPHSSNPKHRAAPTSASMASSATAVWITLQLNGF